MRGRGNNDERRRCGVCGEPIGAYEPLVVIFVDGGVKATSWSQVSAQNGLAVAYHDACAPDDVTQQLPA